VRLRSAFLTTLGLGLGALIVGCSSQAGTTSIPQTAGRTAQSASAYPISLSAYPAGLSAYPISLSAFPISISAYPINVAGLTISQAATAACQARVTARTALCHAEYRNDVTTILDPLLPALLAPGYHPNMLQAAYGVTPAAQTNGSGQTVAIVVAYHAPNLESDLAVYRRTFGLSPCTSASGCLSVVAGNGVQPAYNSGWEPEETLDVEMVSAICPRCHVMAVEAKSDDIADLAQAVDTAVAGGATAVSNSYSAPESADTDAFASHYRHAGIPITAGAGDRGYGSGFPAAVPEVTAVGGTSMIFSLTSGWTQAVWPGTGSGCTAFSKPAWQSDRGCGQRTMNELAIVGDPATGVGVYVASIGGWNEFGGTSVGSPIAAALYALAGNGSAYADTSRLYAHASEFAAVLPRSNGVCTPAYLCTGGVGYSGPSGLGAPLGLGPF